jgi:hypothetical protein
MWMRRHMEDLQWWCIHDLKLSLREGGRGEDEGRTTREARVKTRWEDGPIYTASQDPQVDRREAHFGKRARGAKIGPSEEVREGRRVVRKDVENVSKSAVEARTLGTLGGRSLKKVKRPGARVSR